MTTYTCKCGRTFEGRGDSVTTGNRISRTEYTPDHDCFGCPFMKEVTAEFLECRGTREVAIYGTTASCVSSKASTLHVSSLDFDFIKSMQDFYNSLGVEDPKDPPYPGMENGSGRYQFSFDFPKNNKGEKAKRELIEHFFEPVQGEESYREMFARKDISGCAEQYGLYDKIEKAKEEAKAMAQDKAPVTTVKRYYHFNLVYFVDKRKDNGQYTVFMDDFQHPGPETVTPCATIPDFDTYEQAQNALDGYSMKRGFTTEPTNRAETPTESDLSSDDVPAEAAGEPQDEAAAQLEQDEIDIGPDGMEELAEYPELARTDTAPADDPEDDDAEQPPCDWQNASGADEDEEDSEAPQNNIPAGELVSLRDDAFSTLIDICDSKINQALRTMFELRQTSFSFTAKITFERRGGAFGIKHETGFNFDPIKVKDKGELYDEIPIQLDESGNPIIPYDRQHQINFDELQPGREIKPSGTATVDGNTGIVEDYQVDEQEPEDPPVVADPEKDRKLSRQLPSCDKHDCPFFAIGVDEDCGCCFDEEDQNDGSFAGDVWEAINMHDCKREKVLDAYRMNNPEDDYDGSDEPADPDIPTELDDLPFEIQENSKEDYAS